VQNHRPSRLAARRVRTFASVLETFIL